ncbi:MAG TPA: M17 family peptidase N-terminal domain-containing protein, partial [Candidatus Limnocylindrales bacterium]
MQLRVVTDQPWDVRTDVLVVPIVGEPVFDGPLGELDRRSGGELSALATFGELRSKRYAMVLASAGELPVSRLLVVAAGEPDKLDRETVHHLAAAAERRLSGRTVSRIAIWLDPLAGALSGGAEAVAELIARGVVEGTYEPQAIYRETVEQAPPALEELVLVASGADSAAVTRAAERGVVIGEGANTARTLSNRSANDVSPLVLAEEARALAKQHGLSIDVIGPEKATEMGMGMFMAVGRGSDNPPQMIVLRSGDVG